MQLFELNFSKSQSTYNFLLTNYANRTATQFMRKCNEKSALFPLFLHNFSNKNTSFLLLKACFSSLVGVTILLSLTVFLNMVAETMPATSDAVPLLGKCYLLFE